MKTNKELYDELVIKLMSRYELSLQTARVDADSLLALLATLDAEKPQATCSEGTPFIDPNPHTNPCKTCTRQTGCDDCEYRMFKITMSEMDFKTWATRMEKKFTDIEEFAKDISITDTLKMRHLSDRIDILEQRMNTPTPPPASNEEQRVHEICMQFITSNKIGLNNPVQELEIFVNNILAILKGEKP